jgi:hypothetical protein
LLTSRRASPTKGIATGLRRRREPSCHRRNLAIVLRRFNRPSG